MISYRSAPQRWRILALELLVMGVLPIVIGFGVFHLRHWDLSVPLVYAGTDDVWQLVLTKMVRDTGWFLTSPFMAAPDIAHWNYHSAAQTSSLHSMIMWLMSFFIDDAVKIQQVYYLINFGLISLSAYCACRVLGLQRWAAGSIGLLYAFTSFRIGWLFYAFLANYAAVPLAFLPVVWTVTGRYSQLGGNLTFSQTVRLLWRSRLFWGSVLCTVLVTLSDGYYAFFTLLMLAFAVFLRAGLGDWRRPARLLAPVVLIGVLMSLAVGMTVPLKRYQSAHPEEFAPGGKPDLTLIKRPFEAEVYSSSLKLMIAPVIGHRVPVLANLGRKMVDSNDQARKFAVTKPIVSLGTLCSLLLLAGLAILPIRLVYGGPAAPAQGPRQIATIGVAGAAAVLAYFTFLASISGGVGTLVALVYPTIRAYDRMPLFLAFALMLCAGALASARWHALAGAGRVLAYGLAAALTVVGLLDQIPADHTNGDPAAAARFVAERELVHHLEKVLPADAMVYQFPHSQYLYDSKYYGWGSFAHIRLYLHSAQLRWSNGGAKNSPVENWHDKIATLPVDRLVDEIGAAGFRAMVIDRTVVAEPEYQALKAALTARGLAVTEDDASKLAWLRLPDPGFQVSYDAGFAHIDRVTVSDRAKFANAHLPRMVDSQQLRAALAAVAGQGAATITRANTPAAFRNTRDIDRGMGDAPIVRLSDMAGSLRCKIAPGGNAQAIVTIDNASAFDWQFGSGPAPFKLGIHIRAADDAMLRFDDGMRVTPGQWFVPAHGSIDVTVPMASINRDGLPAAPGLRAEFAVVQEGHAWFDQLRCQLPLSEKR